MATDVATAATEDAGGRRRLELGRLEIGLVALAVTAAVAGTAAPQGGYFETSWGWTALAFGFVAAVAAVLVERVELHRAEVVYLALVGAFLGWVALSIVWSTGVSGTVEEVERGLVFATGSLAFILVARRGQIGLLLGAILLGLVGLAAYALATRLFPALLVSDDVGGYRLATPIGYWNGLGVLCSIATLLAVGFVAEGKHPAVRALAAAPIPLLVAALYFTFSRGAWLALGAAALLTVAVHPARLKYMTTILVLAGPTFVALWLARGSFALTHVGTSLSATRHEGHRLAVWLLALALGSAALALGLHFAARWPIPVRVRQAYGAVLISVAAGAVLFGLVAGGGPVRIAHHAYDRFLANPVANGNLNQRIFQLSSNGRVDLWRVAVHEFEAHPASGTGAGTFESYWYEHRGTSQQTVRDAHSLYVETLGELGVPGLVLLLGMLLVPFAALAARKRPLVTVGAGAYACLLVHAGYDWDWELPAVMLAGAWCGLAALAECRERGRVLVVGMRGRAALVGVATAFAGFAFVGLVGNLAISASTDGLQSDNPSKAAHQARRAAAWAPWAAEPWSLLAQADLRLGRQDAGVRAMREAIERAPRDFTLWQLLAVMTRGPEHREAVRRAHELNPGAPTP